MFLATEQDASFADYQHVGELFPVLIVMIDHQSYVGILGDVLQPFKFGRRNPLRFLVNRRIEIPSIESKADRNHMRLAGPVRRGEMGDAGGAD